MSGYAETGFWVYGYGDGDPQIQDVVTGSAVYTATLYEAFTCAPLQAFSTSGVTYSVTPALPSGLALDHETGLIQGVPQFLSAAKSFTVIAMDDLGSGASFSFTLSVNKSSESVVPSIDPAALGLSRIAMQYTRTGGELTKFQRFIAALMQPLIERETLYAQIALISDIDLMTGVNLDVIGEIVGASRTLANSVPVNYFGFNDQFGAGTYGEEGNLLIGAPFREEKAPAYLSSVLTDEQYRRLIKATIIRNYSHGTGDDVLNAMSIIFDTDVVFVNDTGGMVFDIGIGRILSFQELVLATQLDVFPRPAAVGIGYRAMFDNNSFFGFEDTPNSKTFGEEGISTIGGAFATEF